MPRHEKKWAHNDWRADLIAAGGEFVRRAASPLWYQLIDSLRDSRSEPSSSCSSGLEAFKLHELPLLLKE